MVEALGRIKSTILGFFVFQDDRFVYVNDVVEKITGYRKEELYRMNFWDIVVPEIRDVIRERGRRRQRGEHVEPSIYECPFITKGGNVKWALLSFSNVIYNGKPAGFCTVVDITEKRMLEERYRVLVEKSVAGVYVIQDGVFKYVNPKMAEIWGYDQDEMIGEEVLKFVHPDSREEVRENIEKRVRGEIESINYIVKIQTKNGEPKFIEVFGSRAIFNGKPAVIGTAIDITELRRSEEKYRAMFNYSPSLIAIINEDGEILDLNLEMSEKFGGVSGESIFDLLDRAKAESLLSYIKRCIENEEEISFIQEIGGYYSFTVVPLSLPEGKSCMLIGSDITDLMNLNNLLGIVNDVIKAIVHEKNHEKLMDKIVRTLSAYQCWMVEEGKVKTFDGEIRVCKREREFLNLDDILTAPSSEFAMDCPDGCDCPATRSGFVLVTPVRDEVTYAVLILSKRTEFKDYEMEVFRTMARDIAFGLKSIEIDILKKRAYEQINKNIEYFAYLVDAIRNPLMIILGLSEMMEHEYAEVIMEQVNRIDKVIKKLDQGWLETEKVRDFLKLHPGGLSGRLKRDIFRS
jgi:PAS domain S-box-containing protein